MHTGAIRPAPFAFKLQLLLNRQALHARTQRKALQTLQRNHIHPREQAAKPRTRGEDAPTGTQASRTPPAQPRAPASGQSPCPGPPSLHTRVSELSRCPGRLPGWPAAARPLSEVRRPRSLPGPTKPCHPPHAPTNQPQRPSAPEGCRAAPSDTPLGQRRALRGAAANCCSAPPLTAASPAACRCVAGFGFPEALQAGGRTAGALREQSAGRPGVTHTMMSSWHQCQRAEQRRRPAAAPRAPRPPPQVPS